MSIPGAVFLDTSVFDGQNYNYESVAMTAFVNACKEQELTVILPKSTEQEMLRHINARSNDAAKAIERAADEIKRKAPFLLEWVHYKRLITEEAPSMNYHRRSPPRQNTCRPDRTKNPGALRERVGSIRTSIQGQGGGEVVAAGERTIGGGVA